jgi:hypothetical protein
MYRQMPLRRFISTWECGEHADISTGKLESILSQPGWLLFFGLVSRYVQL